MFKEIKKKIKKVIDDYNRKILFNRVKEKILKIEKNQQQLVKKEQKMIQDIKKELKNINTNLTNLKDINDFKEKKINFNDKKINILIADDYSGIIEIVKNDLEAIFYKKLLMHKLSFETIKRIEKFNEKFSKIIVYLNFEFIDTEYAPYYILNSDYWKIDIAILDIIFGGIIKHQNETLIFDGIDIAKKILEKNKNIFILFFTGCSLHEQSEETRRINELLKEFPNQIHVSDKSISDNERINKFLDFFEKVLPILEKLKDLK